MSDKPIMAKATAVWLVDNTTLSFKQIADFTEMHEREVQGIADGDVAAGVKGFDPVANNQLEQSEIDEAEKNWKFSEGEVEERKYWDDYQSAYEKAINETARPHAPWYVVPADDKKTMRLIVASAVLRALEGMEVGYPEVSDARREELQGLRASLVGD